MPRSLQWLKIQRLHTSMRLFLFSLWLIAAALFSPLTLADVAADNAQIKGAACLVSDANGRVLITRDILNNRLAIPGGFVDSNTPSDAAVRETLEETGIDVVPVRELARMDNAILYDCRATRPIPVHENADGTAMVAAWQAEHFGREVRAVMLRQPDAFLLDHARFPDQVARFPALLADATPSSIQNYADFSTFSTPFNQWNAQLNRAFQQGVDALPSPLGSLLGWASALGNGALFFALLPFAMATGGLKRTGQLLLVTFGVTLIVTFIKLNLAVPRPFYLFPDLQRADASGFSFPSGHTATAFAAWGLVFLWCKRAGFNHLAIWWVPSVLVAMSRVYLGVHYVTDVLAGAVIGTLVVAFSQTGPLQKRLLSPLLWLALGAVTLPLAATQINPVFLYSALFTLTLAATLFITRHRLPQRVAPSGTRGFWVTVLGMVVIAGGMGLVSLWSNSSIEILVANSIGFILLALWLGGLAPKLAAKRD